MKNSNVISINPNAPAAAPVTEAKKRTLEDLTPEERVDVLHKRRDRNRRVRNRRFFETTIAKIAAVIFTIAGLVGTVAVSIATIYMAGVTGTSLTEAGTQAIQLGVLMNIPGLFLFLTVRWDEQNNRARNADDRNKYNALRKRVQELNDPESITEIAGRMARKGA